MPIVDDDFADFQAAPVAAAPAQAPAAAAPPRGNANLMSMLSATPAQPVAGTGFIQSQQAAPPAYGGMGMNVNAGMGARPGGGMGSGMGMGLGGMGMGGHRQTPSLSSPGAMMQPQQPMYGGGATMRPAASLSPKPVMGMGMGMGGARPPATTSAAKPAGGNFDDLWSMSLGSTSTAKAGGAALGKSIKDLEKEKANAGLWGGQQQQQRPMGSAPLPAFGAFGNGAPPSSSNNGGDDDLLL